ncbi:MULTISPECIES: hypothetical protein [Streptomyces]|uniref:Transposase n=2 Tax=Streptomyces TaxID=1883 RepID=A0ABV9INZ0_9ACTN
MRIHLRRQENGKRQTRGTVYAVTSLDTHPASPADLGGYVRGHWGIETRTYADIYQESISGKPGAAEK